MKNNILRILGVAMLCVAVIFVAFALCHPEMSFPWNNTVTYIIYGIYLIITAVLLIFPKRS